MDLPDYNTKSFMLEKLSIVAAKGGLEMEEKLKTIYEGRGFPSCSFLWSSDPDHQLYKKKIAEYTKFPPPTSPTPPAAQNYRILVDPRASQTSFEEQFLLCTEHIDFRVQIPQGMMRKELDIMKFTALFVVRYGIHFWNALWARVSTRAEFKFLDNSITYDIIEPDIKCLFFSRLVHGYGNLITSLDYPPGAVEAVLEAFFSALKKKQEEDEGEDQVVDKVETDRREFVVCDDYFADIENKALLTLRVMMLPSTIHVFRVQIPEGGMMRKELGIIKFTALFVVRYGNEFWDALWDRVSTKTEFQFLKRNPGNDNTLFSQLLLAYGNVIEPWGIQPRKFNDLARVKAVLQGFFSAFDTFKGKQEEQGDEVVDKVVTDRRDFVVSDDYFQYFHDIEEHTPLPVRLQRLHEKPEPKIMTRSPPQLDEPVAKRGKLDESALVSEEEFLAQHEGPSTIKIYVSNDERAIEIRLQSLSENVASLKEKIAVLMRIPANQLKINGRTGVLKDDRSLAYYNLGVEEMLTLDY